MDLLFNLVRNLHNSIDPGVKVNYIKPLYIEDESRKLPGTGYYKGTPNSLEPGLIGTMQDILYQK